MNWIQQIGVLCIFGFLCILYLLGVVKVWFKVADIFYYGADLDGEVSLISGLGIILLFHGIALFVIGTLL